MPYLLKHLIIRDDTSDKPLWTVYNFPQDVVDLKENYRFNVIRPALELYNGRFSKSVNEEDVIVQYEFDTEEGIRGFYAVISDDTNQYYQELKTGISELDRSAYAKVKIYTIMLSPEGKILPP
jgi:hypothetical protein